MELLIGCDPELFVSKGGKFMSGHTIPLGTKLQPKVTKHGALQNDGLALEFNTDPAAKPVDFLKNIQATLADLRAEVSAVYEQAEIAAVPTVHFGRDYLRGLPREVTELGCSPDFSAYTGVANPKPNGNVDFRTGAGHVHLGWTYGAFSQEHFNRCCAITRELDYYLGLPSLSWDEDAERRSLYGQAGAFRPKNYGVEYRVLSNAWVLKDDLCLFIFNQAKKAFNSVMLAKADRPTMFETYGTFAEDCINNSVIDWKDRISEELYKQVYEVKK